MKIDDPDLPLSHVAKIFWILQSQICDFRNRLRGGIGGQFTKSEAPVACRVHHLMISRLDLGDRHAPALGRSSLEHRLCGCTDLAHGYQIVPGASRAVGVLIAELGLVAVGLLDMHTRPVRLHLVGDDHRQAGANARPHFRTMRDDGHDTIRRDGNEDMRIDHRAVGHLVGTSLICGKCLARGERRGQHETAGDPESANFVEISLLRLYGG